MNKCRLCDKRVRAICRSCEREIALCAKCADEISFYYKTKALEKWLERHQEIVDLLDGTEDAFKPSDK